MARAARAIVALSIAATACGGGGGSAPPPYGAGAALGAYEEGSGRTGVAALVTIRGETGGGPDGAWTLGLARDGQPVGGAAAYAALATYALVSWPDVAPTPGGTYEVLASDGERTLSAPAVLAAGAPLAVPAPGLSLDGTRLEWPAVDGAAAYACRLSAGAAIHLQRISPDAACDLAALPAAGYLASIQALSADPEALAGGPAPALPARFDVSQARLGVLRREAGAPLALRAAGGRLDYGLVPGLALWMALAAPDGAPGGGVWSIEVTGPNLPPADPLRFELLANFARRMVWAYDLPPAAGLYTLTARSGAEAVTTQFVIGAPEPLPLPGGVSAQGQAGGAARFTWDAVPGARSYLAAAWMGAYFVAGQWVAGTEARFPDGTFTPGNAYDVYVTATDADMSGVAVPTRVSASENSYTPASFIAP